MSSVTTGLENNLAAPWKTHCLIPSAAHSIVLDTPKDQKTLLYTEPKSISIQHTTIGYHFMLWSLTVSC